MGLKAVGNWVKDRLLGGNSSGMGGRPMPGAYPQAPLARQQQAPGFTPSSGAGSYGPPPGVVEPQGKPWWQNGDVLKTGLNTIGGITSAVLEARNQNQAREMAERRQDFEERQYREEQERKQQMAAYMQPILDRLMGQQKREEFRAPRYGGG